MRWRMARLRPGHARGGVRALGAMIALVGIGTLGIGTASGATPVRQAEQDPLALFSAMMPVFSSPRCVNCHGGVDPGTGENHEGGKVDVSLDSFGNMENGTKETIACLECHTAADKWRTAPRGLAFVGRDALTLCRQIKSANHLTDGDQQAKDDLIFHLSDDYFVGLAFVGQRAIGDDSPFGPLEPAPPPMSREDFVGAAQNWLNAGHTLCSVGWSGSITVTKTSQSSSITQGNTVARDASMNLTETIDIIEGEATAHVVLVQHDFQDSGPKNHDCGINHSTYAVDGKGPATVQIFLDVPSGSPEQTPAVSDSGGVQMFINVPAVTGTHHTDIKTGALNNCRQNLLKDEPYSTPADNLSARGPADPNDPDHLSGTQTELSPDKTITTTVTWKLSRGQ